MPGSSSSTEAAPVAADPGQGTAFRVAMVASVVETASSAISWTGLPVYVVALTGRPELFTWLFTTQTVAGLLATLVAGALTDRFPLRALVMVTASVTAAALLAVRGLVTADRIWPFLVLSLVMQFAGAIAANAVKVWFSFLAPPGDLARWTARRGAGLTVAKLVGTSAGPLVYHLLGGDALLLNAGMALTAALVYVLAARYAGTTQLRAAEPGQGLVRRVAEGFRVVSGEPALVRLIGLQLCAGLLGLPLTAVALRLLQGMPGVTAAHFSIFWAVGFAGAFGANLAIGRGVLGSVAPVTVISGCLAVASAGIATLANLGSAMAFAVGFLVVVVARTTLNVVLFATIVPAAAASHRGRIVAITDLANDGAGLVTLVVFALVGQAALTAVTTGYVLAVACVAYFLIRSIRSERHPA